MTHKPMSEIRDEGAETYASACYPFAHDNWRSVYLAYKQGFDAAHKLLAEEFLAPLSTGETLQILHEYGIDTDLVKELESARREIAEERARAQKLLEALKYYADETEGVRVVNVCEFNDKLNRMYVAGSGLKARLAIAEYEQKGAGE